MAIVMHDVLLTLLSGVLLALACWWFFGRLLRPIPGPGVRAVIFGQGDGGQLEQSVRSLMWLRGMGFLSCPVVILDRGLTPSGRDIARRLAERWPSVVLAASLKADI